MPGTERQGHALDTTDWQFPAELTGAVDDHDDPAWFTVYPRATVDVTTRWLSVEVDVVVDLETEA